jgi:hypothetical protein
MVAHRVSMVAVSTVGNLVAVSTIGNLSAVNIPVGSLVAANIPAGSMVEASIVNVVAMVSIATNANDSDVLLAHKLSGTRRAGEPFSPRQALPKIG